MNPLSSELPFHVHNWLIISLKDFCVVIRKWPTFWPSRELPRDWSLANVAPIFKKGIRAFTEVWLKITDQFL